MKFITLVAAAVMLVFGSVPAVAEDSLKPIHFAARDGDANKVKLLLASGVKADVRGGPSRFTALHLADNADVVRVLLNAGASINAKNKKRLHASPRCFLHANNIYGGDAH